MSAVFLSPYAKLSVAVDPAVEDQIVNGMVVQVKRPRDPVVFRDGRYVALTEEQAEELRSHWAYVPEGEKIKGRKLFTEVTPRSAKKGSGPKAVESVTDAASAEAFLEGEGVDADDLQDVQGRFSYTKAKAKAKELGFVFPNYGS